MNSSHSPFVTIHPVIKFVHLLVHITYGICFLVLPFSTLHTIATHWNFIPCHKKRNLFRGPPSTLVTTTWSCTYLPTVCHFPITVVIAGQMYVLPHFKYRKITIFVHSPVKVRVINFVVLAIRWFLSRFLSFGFTNLFHTLSISFCGRWASLKALYITI